MPNDGKKYELIHKDGNIGNCHAFNLEWKEVRKYFPTDTKRTLDNGLVVEVNGNIYDNGKKLHQQNSLYDGDMQREWLLSLKSDTVERTDGETMMIRVRMLMILWLLLNLWMETGQQCKNQRYFIRT